MELILFLKLCLCLIVSTAFTAAQADDQPVEVNLLCSGELTIYGPPQSVIDSEPVYVVIRNDMVMLETALGDIR